MYYMHGLGHGIGLEVHDPDQYYCTSTIAPGSAFTIEPGIYVREHVLEEMPDSPRNREIAAKLRAAVGTYKNIGVRIEDDYLATDKGVEWISRAPREIDEVEAAMRGSYAGPREARSVARGEVQGRVSHAPSGRCSREQVELQDVPEGGDAVLPVDLLPFGVRPPGVGDRHLIDAGVLLGEPRRDLRLEPEPVRHERARPGSAPRPRGSPCSTSPCRSGSGSSACCEHSVRSVFPTECQ